MSDATDDFATKVGTYEIWPASRVPEKYRQAPRHVPLKDIWHESAAPYLVRVGPAKWTTLKREAMDMAILRLINTDTPGPELPQHDFIELLRGSKNARGAVKTTKPPDFSEIEKSALVIAGHIGMLTSRIGLPNEQERPDTRCESLYRWVAAAGLIRGFFHGPEWQKSSPTDYFRLLCGELHMYLLFGPRGVSMHLRPWNTEAALYYRAAQMLAVGTKLLNCEHCHTPFLSGGEARGGGKRRRDARFCSDKCRWSYHNDEMRRKRKL
jgi:hypothetical protein